MIKVILSGGQVLMSKGPNIAQDKLNHTHSIEFFLHYYNIMKFIAILEIWEYVGLYFLFSNFSLQF